MSRKAHKAAGSIRRRSNGRSGSCTAGAATSKWRVSFGEPRFADDQVTRPVAITEGAMTRMLAVRIDGAAPARLDAARSALNLPSGTPFVAAGLVDATRRLRAYYRNLGYLDAAVSHVLSPKPDGDAVAGREGG